LLLLEALKFLQLAFLLLLLAKLVKLLLLFESFLFFQPDPLLVL
jgi:hypothetical protein